MAGLMATFDNLVNDILRTLQGYGLSQPRAAFLVSGIDSNDLSISVGDATGFEQGVAEIGNETVFIDAVDYGSNILTLAPDGRGYYGSTAASHAANARITMAPVWPRAQVAEAINSAIYGTYPDLYSVATEVFSFNPSINTYELPADTEQVLRVVADTIGSTQEQVAINRYSFNGTAPTAEFATGKSITLEKGAFPGRNVTVTYKGAPTEITFGDNFTECGLRETAKRAIKYAVCSELISFMDSARLPVDTAVADEYDPSRNAVGLASKISAQLYQRYLIELDSERKRLRQTTPTPVTVRTR